MATKKELIASDKEVEEIREILGVDSLAYLSIESLLDCIGIENGNLCVGCLQENIRHHYQIILPNTRQTVVNLDYNTLLNSKYYLFFL